MIGSGGGSGFKNIAVLLTANNSNLKSVLLQSGGQIEAFDKRVTSSNKNLTTTGRLLKVGVAGGALAAAAGLAYAVTQAVAFDKSMRNVNSLAKLGDDAFGQLEKRVISMSTKLPQSATTLAEGLYDIYSSGFKGADAMTVLESAALSASAGLTTTEVSARAIAATLNAYGLQAKDAADVSDVLFQTVNAGVISFDELAGNLGDVVGGAAAAKVGIDQVGSAIAAMTLAGIGGAESTTALNQLLAKIVQPSAALKAVLGDLGYESGAAALETDGLRGVMDKLRVATGGNITTLLELFPEIRAARGALALMANEGKNYASTAAQIEDKTGRAGAAQAVFKEQMKAAGNQMQVLKNQVDATAISVGIQLLPAVIGAMNGLRDLGSGTMDVLQMLQAQFGPGLEDLASILGDLWVAFSEIGAVVWALVEPFAKLAVGATAEVFNDLMAVLAPLTEMISENSGAATVLAIALGVALAGGATKAATALGYTLVLGLVRLLEGMASASAGARALGASLLAAAPAIAIVASITAVVVAWQSYHQAADEVVKTNEDIQAAFDAFDLEKASQGIDAMKAKLDELDERGKDLSSIDGLGDLADDLLRIDKNFRASALIDEDVLGKYEDAQMALDNYRNAGVFLVSALDEAGTSQADLNTLMEDMNGFNGPEKQIDAWKQLDAVVAEFGPKLAELGVELSDGLSTDEVMIVKDYVESLGDTTAATANEQENLVDKLGAVDTALGDTAAAAEDLDKALDALMGAAMGVDAAGIEWRAGLAELQKSLIETGGGIKGNSLAAGENRLAIQDQIGALQDLLVAQAKNGDGAAVLTKTLMNGRDALLNVADAAKIPRSAMADLLKQYKLTPELVQTLIQEHGGPNVKKMLKDIKKQSDSLDGADPTVVPSVLTAKGKKQFKEMQSVMDSFVQADPTATADVDGKKADAELDKLGKKADEVDKKSPTVATSAPGASEAERQLNDTKAAAQRLDGTTATVTTVHRDVKKNADGGISGASPLPSQAKIAPGSGRGMFQWAEGETGGEAFIPLGAGKRSRSVDILGQVAAMFGFQLAEVAAYAKGGIRRPGHGTGPRPQVGGNAASAEGFAPFSFTYPPFKYKDFKFRAKEKKETAAHYAKERAKAQKEYQRDRAQARKDYEKDKRDAFLEAQQEYKEQKRLYETSQGAGAGAFSAVAGDAAGTLGNLHAAAEARAQAAAELKARQTKDPNDTAEDYYKKPILTIKDYIDALKQSVDKTVDWGKKLTKISSTVGADVTAALQAMGEDGEQYIEAMANASVEDMQAMAEQLRAIQMNLYQQDMAQDIAAQSQFQGNLALLVATGHADIAAQFAAMGYKDAGALAAAAVGMTPAELAELSAQIAAKKALEQGDITDAVQLAGLLQASGGSLGIVGLSQQSGKSIGDVVGLLQTFNAQVFSKMPPAFMAQIRADQALLDAGQQPSGLAKGGIVLGSQTAKGQFYRWAEPGSGGESLIPLGLQSRSRALDLWETTGRMIGAGVRSSAGGAGGGVVVMPGAVSVAVDASGQVLSEGQVKAIAAGAADTAMGKLADALTNGRR